MANDVAFLAKNATIYLMSFVLRIVLYAVEGWIPSIRAARLGLPGAAFSIISAVIIGLSVIVTRSPPNRLRMSASTFADTSWPISDAMQSIISLHFTGLVFSGSPERQLSAYCSEIPL